MFDMMQMMGKVKEMQSKMKEAQENLEFIKETGEAGAGMVKATVNGKKQVISIEIDEINNINSFALNKKNKNKVIK